ncbi:MAG: Crp/Fnr family transcriptional regulator [Proteobacteria bacterium]|nr:Crp/Fnr family transcriptional regulator [Pseudomonadota bacterium]
MLSLKGEPLHNRLLRTLKPNELDRLAGAFEFEALSAGQVIDRMNSPVRYVHFVNRGFVSMIKTMRDGRTVEVGGVGIEGVTAPHALFDGESAVLDTVVQIPGSAFRIARDILAREVASNPQFRRLIQNYARFTMAQLAQTAACNRLHSLEERCCRWLLVAHDSALTDRFPLTHEFLATMLGVQRPSVSLAAAMLRKAGLVDYKRGTVTILDRKGLEDMACECYASARDELDVIFAPA